MVDKEKEQLPSEGPTINTDTLEAAPFVQQEATGDDNDEDDDDEYFDNELDDDDEFIEMSLDDKPAMIEQGLYIGSFLAEQNRSKLEQAGITHVLQVAEGLTPSHPCHFKYCNVEVMDMPGENLVTHFDRAFKFIDEAISTQDGAVLVHCVAGVSRSSTVCIGWLMKRHSIGYDEAFRRVHKVRPWVMPNVGFRWQLETFGEQGCDIVKWRKWRHQYAEQPDAQADVPLGGLSLTDRGDGSSNSSSWHASQRQREAQSATYMPELGTSL